MEIRKNQLKDLEEATEHLKNSVLYLSKNRTDPASKISFALACSILERAQSLAHLVSFGLHGGVIDIVRSQMEAAADFMLLGRDREYFKVLVQRQNEMVTKVTNRANTSPATMPSVSSLIGKEDAGEIIRNSYNLAKSQWMPQMNVAFIEATERAGLKEENYRYLCSFSHNNMSALSTRFLANAEQQAEMAALGKLPEDLLKFVLKQATANIYGCLMVIEECKVKPCD